MAEIPVKSKGEIGYGAVELAFLKRFGIQGFLKSFWFKVFNVKRIVVEYIGWIIKMPRDMNGIEIYK
ncbi:hypothetical protein [Desulfobulbus alkaliphilus]|uniref:hypothetical protein n=1 Tax=Desulfobulbus alkaliphilus TaxID=869814 RepID=UPI00196319EE|nr:hypothetical protein [Desulfobulbus alkaliphilus]MBM9538371.1 hypothetical protein [Desulfobulbus alkaliphilus]